MTVKIDNTEPNSFPVIENIDARDSGHDVEVILATRIEGELPTGRRLVDPIGTVSAQQARHNLARPPIDAPAHPGNRHTQAFAQCRPSRRRRPASSEDRRNGELGVLLSCFGVSDRPIANHPICLGHFFPILQCAEHRLVISDAPTRLCSYCGSFAAIRRASFRLRPP
jgi:hypothetical protein